MNAVERKLLEERLERLDADIARLQKLIGTDVHAIAEEAAQIRGQIRRLVDDLHEKGTPP